MNDRPPSFIARIRSRLADWLHALAMRTQGWAPDEWTIMPLHKDDTLGVWVTENEPAYQVLVLFGYPYPPGQEVDWDLEHDLSPVELTALIKDAVRNWVARDEEEEHPL